MARDAVYDLKLDTLTSASYDGGLNTTTWSYDAAGNRNDATAVDNLNRATTIGGVSRTYDILGNTLTNGAKSMGWDELNRMLSFNPGPGGQATLYLYRADGMRVRKGLMASPNVYTEYAYDGQMPVEEYNYRSVYPISFIKVIRYGLGARGVDYIEKVPANGPLIVGYPVYDDHGNMIATLGKNGVLADQRSYDAWGVIRTGNTTGEPHGQYCANLGHLADDESGLIYMRARYYDAGSGRFVSEDPCRDGWNSYAYVSNSPASSADPSGRFELPGFLISGMLNAALQMGFAAFHQLASGGFAALNLSQVIWAGAKGFAEGCVLGGFAMGAKARDIKEALSACALLTSSRNFGAKLFLCFGTGGIIGALDGEMDNVKQVSGPGKAISSILGRNVQCLFLISEMDME